MSNAKTILTTIKKKEKISSKLIHLLYIKKDLTLEEATFLYAVVQLLINEYRDNQVDNRFLLINYAYTIIAITSFKIKDYRALYDFSINYGFYPIARKIIDLNLI